jgi:hypothetical protein
MAVAGIVGDATDLMDSQRRTLCIHSFHCFFSSYMYLRYSVCVFSDASQLSLDFCRDGSSRHYG